MWSVLLFFLLLIYGLSGAETEETESVSVMEGDSVTLHTNLSEILNDDTILWMFGPKDSFIAHAKRNDDLTLFSVTDEDLKFKGRLQVDQKTGSLTIRNTRIKHSGQYKLSISRVKTTIKIFNVTVFDTVDETDGVKSVSISVTEGESVTLRIDAELLKDALLLWRFGDEGSLLAKFDVETNEMSLNDADERFRDRLKLDHQTGSLTIMNTRITDSGLYEVQIRGSESSKQFLLSVNAVPDPLGSKGAKAGIGVGVLFAVLLLMVAVAALIYSCWSISELKKKVVEEKSAKEGELVTLNHGLTGIQGTDKIQWFYETEDNCIAEIIEGSIMPLEGADGRFRSKLRLDGTGNLEISNIRSIHSGLYILKISSSSRRNAIKTEYKKFLVAVSDEKVPVEVGGSVPLDTEAEIEPGDLILWTFGAENRLVVKADSTATDISERFRNRLELDKTTGNLTINNIETADTGHYKLQIINKDQTTFKRFNVIVTDSTRQQENESAIVEIPLLNRE